MKLCNGPSGKGRHAEMTATGNRGPVFHSICVGIMSNNKCFKGSFIYCAEKLNLQYVCFKQLYADA